MKILVVGLGQMGQTYIKTLLAQGHPIGNIFGVDIDTSKAEAAGERFVGLAVSTDLTYMMTYALDPSGEDTAAIVATTTPSHHTVLIELMEHGVSYILCEKPLAIDMNAMKLIHAKARETQAFIFTGFLMNFSPAILHLMCMMEEEGLILTEGSSVWGKNRFGDTRPTPGDLEDETVHGAGILHSLAKIGQQFKEILVYGRLTYPAYADAAAQAKAAALDPSFPARVNASTMAIETISTDHGEVLISHHSSYLKSAQVRRVTAVLCREDSPSSPVYSIEMNFDVRQDGTIIDRLAVTMLDGNRTETHEFACNKIAAQTEAFLAARPGCIDPRLCDYNEAQLAVTFTEALTQSHHSGMSELAFGEADIIRLKEVGRS